MDSDNRPASNGRIAARARNFGRFWRSPVNWRRIKKIAGEIVAGFSVVAAVVVAGVVLFVGAWLAFVAIGGGH